MWLRLFFVQFLAYYGVVIASSMNNNQQDQNNNKAVTLLVAEMKTSLDVLGVKVDSQAARIVKLEKELVKANERIDLLMVENSEDINSKSSAAAAQQLIRPQSVQTQYRTCEEFYSATLRNYQEIGYEGGAPIKSGMYWIDVDGQGVGESPIYVYCNMTDGTTVIGHDAVDETVTVGKCSSAGCFSREIVYDAASPRQLELLIQMSSQCTQQIKIDCVGVPLEYNGVQYAWWVDRRGLPRYFWSGNQSDSMAAVDHNRRSNHTCQCGLDGDKNGNKPCVDPNYKCNCDSLAPGHLLDEGSITDMDLLPVTRLHFGRTALPHTSSQFTLGPFQCKGQRSTNGDDDISNRKMPSNCDQLRSLGHQSSGFYLTKNPTSSSTAANRIQTTFCDFTKTPGMAGYETVIGYNDVKTAAGVYFYVTRNSTYTSTRSVIPYEVEHLNIGGAMHLATGVFTAPADGRYHFTFTGFSYSKDGWNSIQLRLNGSNIGVAGTASSHNNMPLSATLNLKKGDQVDTFLFAGVLRDDLWRYTHFSGILIEEDLSL